MEKALILLQEDLLEVEARFRTDLTSDVPLIGKVGEYVLASGGKRLRPMLVLLCARLAGYTGGNLHIGLASIVEFIHTATLLHDDVVDSAILRRGNASVNSVWGNEASVLVGDFLFAKSFSLMVEGGNLKVLKALSDATTQMAEGEVQQLVNTCDIALTEEEYISVVRNKTAVLIAAACECGGVLGAVSPQQEQALNDFGMDVGIAFQFMDDTLDYVADEAEFGKAKGHDLSEGKVTLPLIHALRGCTPGEREQVEKIVQQDVLADGDLAFVIALIDRYDGIAYTRRRAHEFIAKSKERLSSFPDGEVKNALGDLADYVVFRRK
jgi:octaprenyl-diphosphate synthase